jgi:hypothetical protein
MAHNQHSGLVVRELNHVTRRNAIEATMQNPFIWGKKGNERYPNKGRKPLTIWVATKMKEGSENKTERNLFCLSSPRLP